MARAPNRKNTNINNTSSVENFIRELESEPAPGTVFTGMVKLIPDDNEHLLVAHIGNCNHWVKIPRAALADAQRVGTVACSGHEHVAGRLIFHEPKEPKERAFANLANLHLVNLAEANGTNSDSGCPEGHRVWSANGWICV
jgi:hypothetical protein